MLNIQEILNSNQTIKFEISAADLEVFAATVAQKAIEGFASIQPPKESAEEKLMTKSEVMKICNVCDTTLWLWGKRKYLIPVKVGRKTFYRVDDVNAIINRGKGGVA